MSEPLPEIPDFKNYDPSTGIGDPSTPLSATVLNGWKNAVVERTDTLLDRAETAVAEAEEAAASGTPGPQGDPGPEGPPGEPGAPGSSFGSLESNAIFNGDLSLARLGTSLTTGLVHNARLHDRFVYGQQGAGSVLRWDVDPDVPDATVASSAKFTATTGAAVGAAQEKHMRYAVEGYDFLAYQGRDATLSFWVKGSTPGVYCIAFTNYARDRTYVTEYTIEAAGVWEEKVVHVAFRDIPAGGGWNYTNLQGIGIRFALASSSFYQAAVDTWNSVNVTSSANQTDLGATTGNYIKFAKIQLNVGTQKLPYVKRPIDETLRLCSRYLAVFSDADFRRTPVSSVTTAAITEIYVPLSTELRGLPTVSLRGTRGTDWMLRTPADAENATGTLQTAPSYGRREGLIRFEGGTFTAGQALTVLLGSANGRIVFDAEL